MPELKKRHPLHKGAVATQPIWQMPIPLVMDGDCVCWPDGRDRTPTLSSDDLRKAIVRSAGESLPSAYLASFGSGDVVVATDGLFWITPDWEVTLLDAENSHKVRQILEQQ